MDDNGDINEPSKPPTQLIAFPTKQGTNKPIQEPKFNKGDWIRYYGNDGRLSIAQIEYMSQNPDNSLVMFSDRGIVLENMIVECRKGQNVKQAAV